MDFPPSIALTIEFIKDRLPLDAFTNFNCKHTTITFLRPGYHVIKGYYDHTPSNPSGTLFAFLAVSRENLQVCDMVLFDKYGGLLETFPLPIARSWNWQQGCRLIWLTDSQIIFNWAWNADNAKTVMFDFSTGTAKILFDNIFLDFNIEKNIIVPGNNELISKWRSAYSYPCDFKSKKFPDRNYIEISFVSMKSKVATHIEEIQLPETKSCIPQVSISPDGLHALVAAFSFIDGSKKVEIYLVNLKKGFKAVNLSLGVKYSSHFKWVTNNTFSIYQGRNARFGNYKLMCFDEYGNIRTIAVSSLCRDGHQHNRKHDWAIDTYANKFGRQSLYLSSNSKPFKKVYESFRCADILPNERCDFHPVLTHDGIFIDDLESQFVAARVVRKILI